MNYIYNANGYFKYQELFLNCPTTKECEICKTTYDNEKLSKKYSEPNIIFEKITLKNINYIFDSYLKKLIKFNPKFLEKYILYKNFEYINILLNIYSYLDYKIVNINKLIDNKNTDEDNLIFFNNFMKNNNIKNIPKNVNNILDFYELQIQFQPNNIKTQSLTNDINFKIKDIFKIYLIDLEINNLILRYIIINLNQNQKIIINNAFAYNKHNKISLENDNLPPYNFNSEEVNEFGIKYLRNLFSKPDPFNYIYLINENSYNKIVNLKKNIKKIYYTLEDTNKLYDNISNFKGVKLDELNSCIYKHDKGKIFDIINVFKFIFIDEIYESDYANNIRIEKIGPGLNKLKIYTNKFNFNLGEIINIKKKKETINNKINFDHFLGYRKINSLLEYNNYLLLDLKNNFDVDPIINFPIEIPTYKQFCINNEYWDFTNKEKINTFQSINECIFDCNNDVNCNAYLFDVYNICTTNKISGLLKYSCTNFSLFKNRSALNNLNIMITNNKLQIGRFSIDLIYSFGKFDTYKNIQEIRTNEIPDIYSSNDWEISVSKNQNNNYYFDNINDWSSDLFIKIKQTKNNSTIAEVIFKNSKYDVGNNLNGRIKNTINEDITALDNISKSNLKQIIFSNNPKILIEKYNSFYIYDLKFKDNNIYRFLII